MGKWSKLPLDDPRWCPMKAAIDLLEQQTGDMRLAVTRLERDMASGKLHWMRVDIATGAPERGTAMFWTRQHEIDVVRLAGFEPVRIFRRTRERGPNEPRRWGDLMDFDDVRMRVFGHAYFVWLPDVAKLYPAMPQTAKPGPKPRGDWPTLIRLWVADIAPDDPRRQNTDTLVIDAQDFLQKQIGWAPSNSTRLRTKMRELLRAARS
jgi:hypothetical protein